MDIAITSICQMLMMGAAVLLTAMALAEAHTLRNDIKRMDSKELYDEADYEDEDEEDNNDESST